MKNKKAMLSGLVAAIIVIVGALTGVNGWIFPDAEKAAAETTVAAVESGSSQVTEKKETESVESVTEKPESADTEAEKEPEETENVLPEDGIYSSKEDVALYIHYYGHLPDNYITKKEAEKLGWSGGALEPYAPGKCIGGSRFGNYEGLLPEKEGRTYTECDIDTLGAKSRGAKRIVFSNDGLIYYTDDHYESFTLLYGEDAS